MKKYFFILVIALLGTHLPESLGYEVVSKVNMKLAQIAVAGARQVPTLNKQLEEKLGLYRQWHRDLKSARTGSEFNSTLDNIERDLDKHRDQVIQVTGKSGPNSLKAEIRSARMEVANDQLDKARERVERAVKTANQIGLNI